LYEPNDNLHKGGSDVAKSTRNKVASTVTDNKPTTRPPMTPERRNHFVEVAAHYIAEHRGFADGDSGQDWAHAEMEIDRLSIEGQLDPQA